MKCISSQQIANTLTFSNSKLLQLKYYNSVIANPSGDLPGATTEGNWVYSYMTKYGPWFDAVENKLMVDGHGAKSYGSSETSHMKALVERNKFIHHQSSHGTAYCTCDGNKNYSTFSFRTNTKTSS